MSKGQKKGLFAILGIIAIIIGVVSLQESQQMDSLSYEYFDEGGETFQHYRDEVSTYGYYALASFAFALFCIFMIFAAKDKPEITNK